MYMETPMETYSNKKMKAIGCATKDWILYNSIGQTCALAHTFEKSYCDALFAAGFPKHLVIICYNKI